VNNVNFSLSIGTAVPSSVRVVDVSPALIEINPQWRGHQYFVVHDDIVIVDRSHKIVAVVPTGSSGGAQLHNNNRSAALSTLNLTEEQIREVQIALKQKGFNIGRTDGRLGPRTTEALIAFQRQQGFEANGRPDGQTVTALGLSNMIGAQGGAQGAGQSSTTGQAPPPTSGQGGTSQQQAPAQQNEGANQPSTTGQGSATQHQAPAQPTQPPANQSQHNSGSK
jgi:peptidoglycan hydrolase-like protein with peptidoglycan-binding domain